MIDQLNLNLLNTNGKLFDFDSEEDAEDAQLASKVDYLQGLAGGPVGYRLRRIILCNFWLYGLQEFEIAHGRLFLAGENASGKSSVLAAALPLALDGNFHANRLDTFGGRDRRIEYYVLGGSESSTAYNFERRTTYIALEFEWCNPSQPPFAPDLRQDWLEAANTEERERTRWLTIGLSLAGNVNASERIRALRFVVTDGARLGHDLHLVDTKGVALDHPGFKRMLNEHGVICETVSDYQAHVARYLFGITDLKEFQNIINMMLVLRRPNLGSELNFSKVHDYLKQSLRKIPEEITRRVTGTIERIDTIQAQVERLQEAYEATNKLDSAAQKLAMAGARRAALAYTRARNQESAAQGQVTRLNRELAEAQAERDAAQTRYDELTTEEGQVAGQIAALESSEGLQVAEKLAQVREVARAATEQLRQQTEQLQSAQVAVVAGQSRQERLWQNWRKWHSESQAALQNLQKEASEKAEWPLASAQLEEAQRQVAAFGLDAPEPPQIPQALAALAGTFGEERIVHLTQLEELHRERETRATEERVARDRENYLLAETDTARERRDAAQMSMTAAREEIAASLRRLYTDSRWISELPDYRLGEVLNAALRASLEEYREAMQNFGRDLERSAGRLRDEQVRLLQTKGVRQQQQSDLNKLYRQKSDEKDLTPLRSPRRQQARTRLAVAGVAALPLYALIDFKANIESGGEQAGRIERMLEEAGLLDALVVRPDQLAHADTLLRDEGLSDCRVQLDNVVTAGPTLSDWLAFDPQAVEASYNSNIGSSEWQMVVEQLLKAIALPTNAAGLRPVNKNFFLQNEGRWQHGLLAGHAGAGAAAGFIGTANRRRLRRQELDALQNQLETGEAELIRLNQQIEQNTTEQRQLEGEREQLAVLQRASQVSTAQTELERTEETRQRTEKLLQEAQAQAREIRQSLSSLTTRILQASADIPGAANDVRRVRLLLDATNQLRNGCALLLQSLSGTGERWREYREAVANLERERQREQGVSRLYAESQARQTQAQAQLDELERAMQSADVQELIERLDRLRRRSKELPNARIDAYGERKSADERTRNLGENLTTAQGVLTDNQQKRAAVQTNFLFRLAAYPVQRLTEARALAEREDFAKAALRLLNPVSNALPPDEEQLEAENTRAFNHLTVEFSREQATLAEYGPNLDDEGRVTFVVEDRAEPPALLAMLANQIDIQKTLVSNEERTLFEDFLLQEMAEAIREHIGQTETWVRSINRLLEDLPMVGEHYALEWRPTDEGEMLEGLGSHISRQHRLLRKPAQNLTPEETQLLKQAFNQEIVGLRLRQKDEPGLNFMDALVQIFDYREWFRFSVFVTPTGGKRTRLTDRIAGTRSGAEQLFALYVPLFAALAALYDSAAVPGCPRLLALDEAFDKASVANTQRIMEFLVSQDFQWIMTGPQVSGTGSGIPVSAEYQMMHEKGTHIATAVPFFWLAGQEDTPVP